MRSFRRRAVCNATPSMWAAPGRAAPSQWSGAHQCGVDGELHAPKQWEALGNHFQPSAVECLWCQHVQIANHDVRGHTGATFTATLATAFSTANPHLARCTMMAKGVKLAATSASASSGTEKKTKPAEQKDLEQTRGNAQGKTRRCGSLDWSLFAVNHHGHHRKVSEVLVAIMNQDRTHPGEEGVHHARPHATKVVRNPSHLTTLRELCALQPTTVVLHCG